MAAGGFAQATSFATPQSRTTSIWLTQLVLAASVVSITVLVAALQPEMFGTWTFMAGIVAVVAATLFVLAAPWEKWGPTAVLIVIFVDTVAIGLVASNSQLRLGYLWVFPVTWVAMFFPLTALAGVLGTITAILILDAAASVTTSASVLRVFSVLLSLAFIGITAHLALRKTKALRRLLQRQALRLSETLARRSEQERRTSDILNGVDVGVARISLTGSVLMVNAAYARLYALDPLDHTLPPRSVEYSAQRGMVLSPFERPIARAARGETFSDQRVWLFTPAGEWRVLSVDSKRLAASAREDASMLLVAQDVTAITHAQRERERLTAIASHELKHPLTVLIGNADLALESDDLSPRIRERFEAMLAATERMREMTASMLKTASDTPEQRVVRTRADLGKIVGDSVDSFGPTASANDITIDVRLSGPLPAAADAFRIRQVTDNLVSNAIKYTPRSGRVRIVGDVDEDEVSLTVSDTGIGISAEDLPKIMTPYFRTESAKATASGTGLGLGISREIVASHGGSLSIDSAPGQGTSVTVRLPRSDADRRVDAGGGQ